MKFFKILASLVLAGALVDQAPAVPYASKITVSSSTYVSPFTISYRLNEAADSVSVQIMNGASPVATFAGTTTQGANQVIWDGSVNNAGGTPVGSGNYAVKITANKTRAAWEEVASQRSLGNFGPAGAINNQVFNGFSPNDFHFVSYTDSAHFGTVLGISSYLTPNHSGAITFNSDLSTSDSTDGLASRIFKLPDAESGTAGNGDIWMGSVDPDNPLGFYFTGQRTGGASAFTYGNLSNPEFLENHNNPIVYTSSPRKVIVSKEGISKFAYFVAGNSTITKASIDSNNNLAAVPQTITSFATTNRYGKEIKFDANGNLYFVSKHIANGADGAIYRWNANQITGLPLANNLSEANSVWQITYDTSVVFLMGMAITPSGDCYALFQSPVGGRGIYFVGNTSSATLTKQITATDKVVDLDLTGGGTGWSVSNLYASITSDPAGNLVVFDRNQEQVRMYAPPGNTSQAITAPTAQNFAITGSDVNNWSLY